LLHTWSLGVEEQYYAIYPVLLAMGLWCVYKLSLRLIALPIAIASLCLYITFCLNQNNVFGNFYCPTARFWELGTGCSLFFFSLFYPRLKFENLIPVVAAIGFFCLQLFESINDNLHVATLLMVLASSAVIYSGVGGTGIVLNFLQHQKAVYIGRISYSLCLWHLPIIYFCNLYLEGVSFFIVSSLVTLGCAILSYHLIEQPVRCSRIFDSFLKYGIPCVLVAFAGSIYFVGPHNAKNFINEKSDMWFKKIEPINYISKNFKLEDRGKPDWGISGKEIYTTCHLKRGRSNYNELNLISECLKIKDYQELFFFDRRQSCDTFCKHDG
jgi:peptidoglycan/LPS O-acetylase OafA/YrhL